MNRQPREFSRPRRGQRPRPGARQPTTVVVLILALSLVTALALLGLAATLAAPVPAAPTGDPMDAAHVALVRAFYAAVNDAARTGDTAPLAWLVAPDFAWCDACPGQPPTRDGLRRYLIGLHQTAPDARLTVDAIVAADAMTVTAQVHDTAYPLAAALPWGPVDTFRVAGGLLAGRRRNPEGVTLAAPLGAADIAALPPAVTGLSLTRLFFPPGSGASGLVSPGPTLLAVEAGTLAARMARGGPVVRSGGAAPLAIDAQRGSLQIALGPGDTMIVPAGARYDLMPQGGEPAVALAATLYFPGDGPTTTPRRPDAPLFVPPQRIEGAPPPPAVQPLAAGSVAAWPSGPVRLGLAQLVLGPGATCVPPRDETELLAVDTGALVVDGLTPHPVRLGGIVRPAGGTGAIRNPGNGSLVLLVMTVAPTADVG